MKYQIEELTENESLQVATNARERNDGDIAELLSYVKKQGKEMKLKGLAPALVHKTATRINRYCIRFLVAGVSASEITLNGVPVVVVKPTGKTTEELKVAKQKMEERIREAQRIRNAKIDAQESIEESETEEEEEEE
ncbi:MAG: hypothetical protein ACYCS1_05470 [Gammaproteobacteria bacterium]